MENQILVREIASRINELINIPLINEKNEQIFFELIVNILMQNLLNVLDIDIDI
ncbi:MAG: hypothetical protein WC368_08545 [Candidatus Cloacimonadaceae bacterium]|jgi:hypothetical protein|nr:hypothetical protein [Candidatus Cloacimonadota bacterium]MCB5277807.1 hypothetical protein [Candidatus Cloacimonadota bacterium]MCK9435120.1 hypothetical protein [Candidatus Cloacimonadota bacterium]MDD5316712.1 hypothetical protein [Candidatus Cloacimonadota bacterium]NLN34747.1 hypothetical protein [Candidatus Cloacimonadota bacterium]